MPDANLLTINPHAKPDQIARILTAELPPENLETLQTLLRERALQRKLKRLALTSNA